MICRYLQDAHGMLYAQMLRVERHIEVDGHVLQIERVRYLGLDDRRTRYLVTLQHADGYEILSESVADTILDTPAALRDAEDSWWHELHGLRL